MKDKLCLNSNIEPIIDFQFISNVIYSLPFNLHPVNIDINDLYYVTVFNMFSHNGYDFYFTINKFNNK